MKVSVNGLILDLNEFRTLRHGDYILIRIAPTRGPDGRRRLRQAFGIPEDFEGLEYTTETGIARISGDGRRAQHGTPSLYHVPQTRTHQQLHEAYWLCMGTLHGSRPCSFYAYKFALNLTLQAELSRSKDTDT